MAGNLTLKPVDLILGGEFESLMRHCAIGDESGKIEICGKSPF